ncbi:hypothetical protein HaLaN_13785, partial [Haematococcus lacustris]
AAPVPAPTPVVVRTSPTTPKQGLAERKAQTLADLAQASVAKAVTPSRMGSVCGTPTVHRCDAAAAPTLSVLDYS